MGEDANVQPTRQVLLDQLMDIAAEVAMLRESMTTAAEWDLQARLDRQRQLDQTLVTVRRGQRILVAVNVALVAVNLVLIGLLLWPLVWS